MRDLAENFTLNKTKAMLEPEPEDFDKNEIEAMLELEPEDFDQSELGRRKYEENPGKATSILKHYLKHHNFGNTESDVNWKQLITFHLGQAYAGVDEYEKAVEQFEKLKKVGYDNVGKEYLDTTILFLKKDKSALTTLRKKVENLNEEECMNKNIIKSFLENFDKSYQEAYASE